MIDYKHFGFFEQTNHSDITAMWVYNKLNSKLNINRIIYYKDQGTRMDRSQADYIVEHLLKKVTK